MARHLILGSAGHIDHGKTALVRALTGVDTDRLPQEKQRGVTIDIGFASLDLGSAQLGVVDVPGHERFIRNMLAGATGVDIAMLVVAADDSIMPQTREHLAILELLGVKLGVVVITKIDLVEASWVDLVESDVRALVEGTFLEGAPIVRASATRGDGVETLKEELTSLCAKIERREAKGPFRLAVDRSFTLPGRGTIVTGTVWSGEARVGDALELARCGRRVVIRGLHSHGCEVERIAQGQRAAINLRGVARAQISRGDEVAAPGFLRSTRLLTVRLKALDDSPWPIRHRSRVRLFLGTKETAATVRLLRSLELAPGDEGLAQLLCEDNVVATGRQPFVVRSESPMVTIGGGLVLTPVAGPIARRNTNAIHRLERLAGADDQTRVETICSFYGYSAWSEMDLCRDADVTPDAANEALQQLTQSGAMVELRSGGGARRVHQERYNELRTRLLEVTGALHDEAPLDASIERVRLYQQLAYLDRELLAGAVDKLIEEGALVGDDRAVARADFQPSLSDEQAELRDAVIEAHKAAAFRPPSIKELASSQGVDEDEMKPVVDLCVGQGALVRLGGSLRLHADWDRELRRRVKERLESAGSMTVSDVRDLLETTRKYAIPICEYLDRVGVTRRRGDLRVLAGSPAVGVAPGASK